MSNEIQLIVVATINKNEMESFNTYIEGLTQCYEKTGVKTLAQYPIKSTYLGHSQPDFVSVLSFQDEQAFDAVYKSKTYEKLLEARQKAFSSIEVYMVNN